MTLPSTGSLSMSQINTELGRSATATISLDTAENGGYATINEASCKRPDAANPARISEWRGYDHNASAAKNRFVYAQLQASISLAYPLWNIIYQVNSGGWTTLVSNLPRTATTCAQRGAGFTVNDGDYLEVAVQNANGISVAYNAQAGTTTSNCPGAATTYSLDTTPFGVTLDACTLYIGINVAVSGGNYVIQ